MKNKIISYRLWLEGLRRVRIPGFIALGFIAISAILVPAAHFVEAHLAYDVSLSDRIITTETAVHPALVLLPFIVAPAMAFTLFSFLNKRRSSDFFHALPYTRTCVFASFSLSIVTWLCFIAVATSILNLGAYAVFGFRGALPPLLKVLPQVVIGAILAGASVTLAMTLTGTFFSNLTVSALILYFPKICALLFATGVTGAVQIVPLKYFPVLRYLRYNLASSVPSLTTDPVSTNEVVTAIVYSAVLTAVYYVLACVAFSKRKSETAERSAPNRALQTVFRIAVTMVICMPVCTVLLFNVTDESYVVLIPVLFLYTVALTVWVLWELITTKRWINVLKSLPYLGIVVLLNVAVILGMHAAKNAILNFTPAPEEIKSVTVFADGQYNYLSTYDMVEYAEIKKGDRVVTDENAIRTVSGVLSRAVNSIKKDGTLWSNYYGGHYIVDLKIESTRGTRYRTLYLTESEFLSLESGFPDGPTGEETRIPDAIRGTVTVSGIPELDGSVESDLILSIMRDELREADAGEWREYLLNTADRHSAHDNNGADIEDWAGYLGYADYGNSVTVEFSTSLNGYIMKIRIPLTRKYFPNATEELISYVGGMKNAGYDEVNEEIEKLKQSYSDFDPVSGRYENDYLSGYYDETVIVFDKETEEFMISDTSRYTAAIRKTIKNGITNKLPEDGESFYILTVDTYSRETGEETVRTFVSAISDEAAEGAKKYYFD